MQWENLTSPDFARAVKETGVCLVSFGVVERHSDHLPLGTDFLNGHAIASLAAEQEPAVVFPPFYFGQIYEARCFPGTIALKPTLLMELIQSIFDEIGRNGFKKIILVNAHGGNGHLLPFLAQSSLYEQKPYSLYLYNGGLSEEQQKEWDSLCETDFHGHACECETSSTLANYPELVHMERVPENDGKARGRMQGVEGAYAGIWWYADFPTHYAGNAHPATREKGLKMRQMMVDNLSAFIRRVKQDTSVPTLEQEFFDKEAQLRK